MRGLVAVLCCVICITVNQQQCETNKGPDVYPVLILSGETLPPSTRNLGRGQKIISAIIVCSNILFIFLIFFFTKVSQCAFTVDLLFIIFTSFICSMNNTI